jgi:hypothetical protein
MYRLAALTLLLVAASSARAQVIYAPVQYQYTNGITYYYGGNDPSMFGYIDRVKCRNGYPSDVAGHHYNSLRHTLGQVGEPVYVFSDCLKYRNAAVYGYTVDDVKNEAMANMPLYFTKRDLLESAIPAGDGTLVVPAMGKPMGMMSSPMASRPAATQPAEPKPRAIIIIPKGMQKKAPETGDLKKVVASAN